MVYLREAFFKIFLKFNFGNKFSKICSLGADNGNTYLKGNKVYRVDQVKVKVILR